MMPVYFIEILSRNGEVQQRHCVRSLPIHIGRGYDNDVILDDVHTASHHAIVEMDADGNLIVRDLSSLNGLVVQGRRQQKVSVDGNRIIRLGQTNLRIRTSDFTVENEAVDSNNYGWEGWPPALAGLALICLLSLSGTWLSEVEKFAPIRYLIALAQVVATVALWSGIWAFANRLFGGHARFGRHLFIAACGMSAAQVFGYLSSLLGFAFSWEIVTRYGSHIFIAIMAATLYFHLSTIRPRHTHRLLVTAIMLSVMGSGLMLMTNYQRTGRLADELYMNDLFSPTLRMSGNDNVAHFMATSEKLKARVDSERSREVSNNETEVEVETEAESD
jgi:pSer/pThr/pTyr-binding forkhead associated (FHA) protein